MARDGMISHVAENSATATRGRAFLVGSVLAVGIAVGNPTIARGLDFDCRFDRYVSSSIEQGEGADLFDRDSDDFGFLFLDVDRATRTAVMRGNKGRSNVTLVESEDGELSFIELTPSGNVTVTTIFGLPTGANLRQRYAVHSRHIRLHQNLAMFSQWAGHCTELQE